MALLVVPLRMILLLDNSNCTHGYWDSNNISNKFTHGMNFRYSTRYEYLFLNRFHSIFRLY